MNSITITNATNGAIITVTTIHHHTLSNSRLILPAILAVTLIGAGLYLLFRKEKSK